MSVEHPIQRESEKWFGPLTLMWDWFDKRDIDKHAMSWAVFYGTAWILWWATHFVQTHPDKPGLEVAAIIAAVMVPWTPLQAAVVNWYFRART